MLDITKILRDIDDLGRERAASLSDIKQEMALADTVLHNIARDPTAALAKIDGAQTSWLLAGFDESPDTTYPCPPMPDAHAVVAVDGSQIMPDKHEATLCYLLNSATIILYYGNGERPVARTAPKLYFRDADLSIEPYGKRRVPINEKLVGIKRTLAESGAMADGIRAAKASGIPTVAMWDGSLILWSLQNEPPDYREAVLQEYLSAFEAARDLGVPIAGYVSDPGSRDFVNSMRVTLCDQPSVNCDLCAHRQQNEPAPCDKLARLKDSSVFGNRLAAGERSVLFTSKSSILDQYGEHRTLAFYMNVGREIARVEVPKWVADDKAMLGLVHAVCMDQCGKGRGYPVALAEAHEHAVVRGPERRAFYQLVERSFMKHGAKVSYSLKRISKGY